MDIEQNKPGRLPEHFRHMKRIRPPIVEQLAQPFHVLFHHVLLKVRHLVGPFRAGEVENEWSLDDRHFDYSQFLINMDEIGNRMPGDVPNPPVVQDPIDFYLTRKSLEPIEKLHCR